MNDEAQLPPPQPPPRTLWVRLLLMLLMACAFQLAASVLVFIAVVQLLLAAALDAPNARLQHFGRSLASYLAQIAAFESFASEDVPFPFGPWPEKIG